MGEILSLPMYPELSDEQIGYVAQAIKEFYTK
jgi:dTDP-4-amino-4,6-dideoxygalactose transaminase